MVLIGSVQVLKSQAGKVEAHSVSYKCLPVEEMCDSSAHVTETSVCTPAVTRSLNAFEPGESVCYMKCAVGHL